jgi:hypothetical protein
MVWSLRCGGRNKKMDYTQTFGEENLLESGYLVDRDEDGWGVVKLTIENWVMKT